jgi:hypothetical protein
MTQFAYYFILEVILYGMIISKVLESWSYLLYYRKTVKFYWPQTLIVISLLIMVFTKFKNAFFSPDYENIVTTFGLVVNLFIPVALLYMLLFQLFPIRYKKADVKAHFFSNYYLIVGLMCANMYYSTLDVYLVKNYPIPFELVLAFAVLWTIPLVFKNEILIAIISIISILGGIYLMI